MGNTGCCGLGGERKSSPIDRENVRESDTDEKKLKSAAPQNKNGAASSTSKDSKNNIKRKNSVLEGVLPPGISSKDMLRYDDDDVSMVVDSSDDMMPPEGNRPPGLAKVKTGTHLNGGNKHLKAPVSLNQQDSAWVDDDEIPQNEPEFIRK